MKKEEVNEDVKKSTLTFFILFFPSVLVAAVGFMVEEWITHFALVLLVLLWQFVVMKNFIDAQFSG